MRLLLGKRRCDGQTSEIAASKLVRGAVASAASPACVVSVASGCLLPRGHLQPARLRHARQLDILVCESINPTPYRLAHRVDHTSFEQQRPHQSSPTLCTKCADKGALGPPGTATAAASPAQPMQKHAGEWFSES